MKNMLDLIFIKGRLDILQKTSLVVMGAERYRREVVQRDMTNLSEAMSVLIILIMVMVSQMNTYSKSLPPKVILQIGISYCM